MSYPASDIAPLPIYNSICFSSFIADNPDIPALEWLKTPYDFLVAVGSKKLDEMNSLDFASLRLCLGVEYYVSRPGLRAVYPNQPLVFDVDHLPPPTGAINFKDGERELRGGGTTNWYNEFFDFTFKVFAKIIPNHSGNPSHTETFIYSLAVLTNQTDYILRRESREKRSWNQHHKGIRNTITWLYNLFENRANDRIKAAKRTTLPFLWVTPNDGKDLMEFFKLAGFDPEDFDCQFPLHDQIRFRV